MGRLWPLSRFYPSSAHSYVALDFEGLFLKRERSGPGGVGVSMVN